MSVGLRGSGFENGAQVMFGGAGTVVTLVDSSTLEGTARALPTAPARITVVNPDDTIRSRRRLHRQLISPLATTYRSTEIRGF